MRWRHETRTERRERLNNWHRKFAILPKRDSENGYTMWLEFCLRKSKDKDANPPWLYRPITLLEKDVVKS